ncbi:MULTISPECIES: TetR/AcrR family transcriptional regulator [Nocardia]|uniref:TetR/AcrR family transcriptional regulator n=1 Tax=Nocardia TaxID=1817 RepID=UPI001E4919D6|nr:MULTISPECIES: helix-turn-helix domain-containing protein [Nocardia]
MSIERRPAAPPRTSPAPVDPPRADADSASTPRRRMSAADRRAQLLDIARDIVAAEGFAAVTIERVARSAPVARALVYQQFVDLSGLMTALLERESEIALAGISTIDPLGVDDDAARSSTDDRVGTGTEHGAGDDLGGPTSAGDLGGPMASAGSTPTSAGRDDVDRVGRAILAYLHASPTSWQIMLSPPDGGPPGLRERLDMGRAYARAIGAGHLSRYAGVTVDPDGPTQRLLLAAIEEIARLHLADRQNYPDELVLSYLRSLVDWATAMESPRDPT